MPCAMIICAGSRGDVEPFTSLAYSLASAQAQPWKVILCVQSDYSELTPSRDNIKTVILPICMRDMHAVFSSPDATEAAAAAAKEHNDPTLFTWSCLGSMSDTLIVPSTQDVLAAAEAASVDVVVYTLLTRPLALTVADKLQVKSCYVQLQPQVPTAIFHHHRNQKEAADGIVKAAHSGALESVSSEDQAANLESYWTVERTLFKACGSSMNAAREAAGLAPMSYDAVSATAVGKHPGMVIANAFPRSLVPHVADLEPTVHHVGPLADSYMPLSWEPPVELEQYLAAGTPPVCVSFGSLSMTSPEQVTQLVYSALRSAGVLRAVLVGGTAGIGSSCLSADTEEGKELVEWARMHVFHAGAEVPYAWLLPRCCTMLCQGGAGVVAAALRGGTALVVAPLMADQFMWGRLVDAMGLGAFAGPALGEVSVETLTGAIEKANGAAVQGRVGEVQQAIQGEELGVNKLAGLLGHLLSGSKAP